MLWSVVGALPSPLILSSRVKGSLNEALEAMEGMVPTPPSNHALKRCILNGLFCSFLRDVCVHAWLTNGVQPVKLNAPQYICLCGTGCVYSPRW